MGGAGPPPSRAHTAVRQASNSATSLVLQPTQFHVPPSASRWSSPRKKQERAAVTVAWEAVANQASAKCSSCHNARGSCACISVYTKLALSSPGSRGWVQQLSEARGQEAAKPPKAKGWAAVKATVQLASVLRSAMQKKENPSRSPSPSPSRSQSRSRSPSRSWSPSRRERAAEQAEPSLRLSFSPIAPLSPRPSSASYHAASHGHAPPPTEPSTAPAARWRRGEEGSSSSPAPPPPRDGDHGVGGGATVG